MMIIMQTSYCRHRLVVAVTEMDALQAQRNQTQLLQDPTLVNLVRKVRKTENARARVVPVASTNRSLLLLFMPSTTPLYHLLLQRNNGRKHGN